MENQERACPERSEGGIKSISTFVIHLWREGNPLAGKPLAWRGRIEHVQSGKRQNFTDFQKVVEFLETQAGASGTLRTAEEDRGT